MKKGKKAAIIIIAVIAAAAIVVGGLVLGGVIPVGNKRTASAQEIAAVSYTHLTLPTSDLV